MTTPIWRLAPRLHRLPAPRPSPPSRPSSGGARPDVRCAHRPRPPCSSRRGPVVSPVLRPTSPAPTVGSAPMRGSHGESAGHRSRRSGCSTGRKTIASPDGERFAGYCPTAGRSLLTFLTETDNGRSRSRQLFRSSTIMCARSTRRSPDRTTSVQIGSRLPTSQWATH